LDLFDFYQFEEGLTPAQKKKQLTVREFVTSEVLPQINSFYEHNQFPAQWIPELARLGVFGSTIKGYGCAGEDYLNYGLVLREIERGDSGLRSLVSVQGALSMYPISLFGSEELKKKYLAEMAQGKLIGCFGLTEPDHGSNPSGMTTSAVADGDSYVLNGHKKWLTNGPISHLAIIWAKDFATGKIKGFVIPRETPGLSFTEIKNTWSLRTALRSECSLENVRVPKSHVLNVEGLKGPFSCLNLARYGISWGVLGAAQACLDEALCYAKNREQFGKPLASFQLIQAKLVTMWSELTKGQALAFQLAKLWDAGTVRPEQISLAKMNNVSTALQTARLARDILGANGITYNYHTGRHLMNLETVNTYEGTEDIHRLILGNVLTGIQAFS
jgi:glutaryl-CoA dehydrogenase